MYKELLTQSGSTDWQVALGGFWIAGNIDFLLGVGDISVLILGILLNCAFVIWAENF